MKKLMMIGVVTFSLLSCNPNNTDKENKTDTTNYGNAGMSGTMNANGMLPTDSNKTINRNGSSASVQPMADSTNVPPNDSSIKH